MTERVMDDKETTDKETAIGCLILVVLIPVALFLFTLGIAIAEPIVKYVRMSTEQWLMPETKAEKENQS